MPPNIGNAPKPSEQPKSYHQGLLDGLSDAFTAGKFTDVDLVCEGVVFPVHRVVICAQSKFFDSALKEHFKVRGLNTFCGYEL